METESQKTPYRVLALKYRPQNFDQLIGQDALVRTLTNAIDSGRIAHAFMLTGVRGVGKTTTARIIAKALNYIGPDGTSGPTTGPTDDCPLCKAIAEDRHPDVIEMDAASRTGVDDIREILDSVRYAPVEARYKIYIIDEVHMLSKQAFNALLKTLEEPPPHVKFIFATTEIRKVPITVLSRCQRFDLRRVDADTLIAHFKNISAKENVSAEDEALAMIARAADGSVRDGLSILDRAISLSGGNVTAAATQDMLGLADRARNIDLLEHILSGKPDAALEILDSLYRSGADPLIVLQDLLDVIHQLSRLRAVPALKDAAQTKGVDGYARIVPLAEKLSMPSLSKAWQILLKGLPEVSMAPNPQAAAEMVVLRLCYAADLPDPADLLKKLSTGGTISAGATGQSAARSRETETAHAGMATTTAISGGNNGGASMMALSAAPSPYHQPETSLAREPFHSLQDVITFLEDIKEVVLANTLYHMAHLVRIEAKPQGGVIEMRLKAETMPHISSDLSKILRQHAPGWMLSLSSAPGAPTLAEVEKAKTGAEREAIRNHPLVAEIFHLFPDAEITAITDAE